MIEIIEKPGDAWDECESELAERGVSLPLYHRAAWARALEGTGVRCSFLAVRDAANKCLGGFAVESARSRTMPGHRLLSIQRLGVGAGGLDERALSDGLAELVRRAQKNWPVLRITVDAFGLDPDAREQTSRALQTAGFHRVPTTRSYERTLVLDLTPTEDALFAALHKNARSRIRSVARFPVQVSTATSTSLSDRLQTLSDETRGRTGGDSHKLDWHAIIAASAQNPELSRIAILERTDKSGPESVIAFAWGCLHGDVAEYSESGSIRPEDLQVSTSYVLLWDLVLWARRSGARWFDFGGITAGAIDSDDPLGGISEFKRKFAQRELDVGEQWELEPRPTRARIARLVSRGIAGVRAAVRR